MKNLILTILFFFTLAPTFANDAYTNAMKQNLAALEQASTTAEYTAIANTFERIASTQTEEWLPAYYSAYTNLLISNLQPEAEAKDTYLDKAQAQLDKAIKLQKDNSEIVALQGFILMMKVSVDPASRGQALAGKVMAAFEKAVQLDDSNPRAQFLLGNWTFGMAQFFKASTAEACGLIKNSLLLFEEAEAGELDPQWGKEMATGMLKYCE